ncbi:class I SAM-dependent methyltransferase [Sinobaca sp. H24]|uniref:class I SAM-dependent DNA methyltransferase n=1 Tax=Sinobaca sp. H24 TaxID=2923376 RepID=UPI002079B312|nr:class I SAM-dependent methyltransferase [Sinobaca sp. H24]
MNVYGDFSRVYDELMGDAPYEKWNDWLKNALPSDVKPSRTKLLDAGCGTGTMLRRMLDEGFDAEGMDLSADMLTVARNKLEAAGYRPLLFQQNLSELKAPAPYSVITAFCDTINYLTEEHEVKNAFEAVFASLETNGRFLFDVHSVFYMQNVLNDFAFSEVRDNLAYIWNCFETENQNEIIHELTLFIENAEGSYERSDEEHVQKAFTSEQYSQWLFEAGFSSVKVYADFSFDRPEAESERLFFIAEKDLQ